MISADACMASWRAAMRAAGTGPDAIINYAGMAGMLLERHGGDRQAALNDAREYAAIYDFWLGVMWTLEQVVRDDPAEAAE